MAKKVQSPLSRVVLRPETASPSVVLGIALAPSVVAGLLLFRFAAAEILGIALLVGVLVHLGALALRQPMQDSPALAAVVGVAMIGPGTPLPWAALIAVAAAVLELARVRFAPNARLQMGLLVYVAVLLVAGGAPTAYLNPVNGAPLAEPIRLWRDFYGGAQTPIDPIKLYVGNVAGPVFATSLLAVALGAAWLWYARRLSLLVVLMFGLGALASVKLMGWSAVYHLDSGPLWFTAALVLADRRMLPPSGLGRPLLGLAAGVVCMAARVRGAGIEAVPITVAALLIVVALLDGLGWLIPNRRRVKDAARAARAPDLATRLGHKVRAS